MQTKIITLCGLQGHLDHFENDPCNYFN